MENDVYVSPRGTKLPKSIMAELRFNCVKANLKGASDAWLIAQIRTMPFGNPPILNFIAAERIGGIWRGWVAPCEAGQGIAYDYTANDEPCAWGWPVKRDGTFADQNSLEYVQAKSHIESAWQLYRAKMQFRCTNCHGHVSFDELSGFWADTGKENAALINSPFRREMKHYPCPVCDVLRRTGKGPRVDWGLDSVNMTAKAEQSDFELDYEHPRQQFRPMKTARDVADNVYRGGE